MSTKPALTDLVRRTLDEMTPSVHNVMGRALVPVFENARARWPVRKKGSRDSRGRLGLKFVQRGERFTASLENDAPYAGLIHEGQTVEELIFKPGLNAADDAATEIAEEFARRAGKVR